jgi:hypothetical protein
MKYARLDENGVVIATLTRQNAECTLAIPDEVDCGWQLVGETWAEPPAPVPAEVTRAQLFAALYAMNTEYTRAYLRAAVEQLAGEAGLIWFDEAQVFKINNPYVIAVVNLLGWTEQQLHDLFRAAASLE